jgi:hypothetical protein
MNKISILSVAIAALVTSAIGQTTSTSTTTTTTTSGTGTLTEYAPGERFIVKETSGPVTYHYGKKVTYVTKSGKTLTDADVRTRIKVGAPVRYDYATEGDRRVISRVEIDDD